MTLGMYGNVNRKKHPDGGYYRDYFYYACKHRTFVNGHKCTYRKQWNEDKINAAVEEVIRKLVNNPKFKEEIQKHIGQSIDTKELDREHTGLQERLKQVTGAKNKLASQMDNLSVSDKHYDKKYEDMQVRLDKLFWILLILRCELKYLNCVVNSEVILPEFYIFSIMREK